MSLFIVVFIATPIILVWWNIDIIKPERIPTGLLVILGLTGLGGTLILWVYHKIVRRRLKTISTKEAAEMGALKHYILNDVDHAGKGCMLLMQDSLRIYRDREIYAEVPLRALQKAWVSFKWNELDSRLNIVYAAEGVEKLLSIKPSAVEKHHVILEIFKHAYTRGYIDEEKFWRCMRRIRKDFVNEYALKSFLVLMGILLGILYLMH